MAKTISQMPKEVHQIMKCNLLHTKTSFWTGEYHEVNGEKVPYIKWTCEECRKLALEDYSV